MGRAEQGQESSYESRQCTQNVVKAGNRKNDAKDRPSGVNRPMNEAPPISAKGILGQQLRTRMH